MRIKTTYYIFAFLLLILLGISACFNLVSNQDAIATSVAQTQTAENRPPPNSNIVENTPADFTQTASSTTEPTITPHEEVTETPGRVKGKVVEVIDGDTIKVQVNGEVYTVRYIGIDSPEVQEGEYFGKEASDANKSLVEGKEVYLEKDTSNTDNFGRLLRYVYTLDGLFINSVLVRLGYAEAISYPPDTKYQSVLENNELQAKDDETGIWASTPTLPPTLTKTMTYKSTETIPSSADVKIVSVDKREEYVDIKNFGNQTQSLNGWILRSERGDQDCYLKGDILKGQLMRIWAMSEDSEKEDYNCGFGSNIWNNSKSDPAVLIDDNGEEVDRYP